jgi:hypothetical protein
MASMTAYEARQACRALRLALTARNINMVVIGRRKVESTAHFYASGGCTLTEAVVYLAGLKTTVDTHA